MEEASSPSVEVEPSLRRSATWGETFQNVIAPTMFGMAAGGGWQALVSPHLTYGMPNPPQGGLLLMMLFAPLLHRLLTHHPQHRWKEYLGGVAALAFPLMLVWSTGLGGFVCGGYLAVVVWIWVSTSWWRFDLPPFRSAMWHTMGVNIGALGGSLLTYYLVMV
ncbi:MAG: hypothetical protein VX068_04770 [Candidatus Thermoplasmatota archaeon]|nr:hypothetical protein [Candidatus Thermoplasmatota archaeon]MEC8151941.1 hypothetical protein [Candidatus Thermoplasmatota archaeon]MEC8708275.1 hypothetical protein [Candidatus Thermoplasmatota archaeon]|tara:strand:- start:1646 stop:2134 length:489 start_codon:yes stop_codon:yes gene_type:complete